LPQVSCYRNGVVASRGLLPEESDGAEATSRPSPRGCSRGFSALAW
jgi:hypothetical protein